MTYKETEGIGPRAVKVYITPGWGDGYCFSTWFSNMTNRGKFLTTVLGNLYDGSG